jgi:peptide/nickel transport system substrate-binding protein
VIERYGDMKDWRNAIGTGPFILKDYVPGSLITYVRNPDYWQDDPLHPENQLPYFDTLKELVIPDKSTQLAAFRTGKVDMLGSSTVLLEDFLSLKKTNPELKYVKDILISNLLYGRMDKPELPFQDIRVRQAMNMAFNRQEMVDEYYMGETEVFSTPFPNTLDYAPFFTPLEEQNEAVKELFSYNPEKARQLLAEAGYPDGFKTEVICSSADADFVSMLREYLLNVGIDMEIKPVERGVYIGMRMGRRHEEMIYAWCGGLYNVPYKMGTVRLEHFDNYSFYENPRTREAYNEMNKWIGKDDAIWTKIVKDITPFIIEEAIAVWLPAPPGFTVWHPWLQNYHGESIYAEGATPNLVHYIWIDEALKKSMGY